MRSLAGAGSSGVARELVQLRQSTKVSTTAGQARNRQAGVLFIGLGLRLALARRRPYAWLLPSARIRASFSCQSSLIHAWKRSRNASSFA